MHANRFCLRVKVHELWAETARNAATQQIDQLAAPQAEVIKLRKQLTATQERENKLTTLLKEAEKQMRRLMRQLETEGENLLRHTAPSIAFVCAWVSMSACLCACLCMELQVCQTDEG